MLEHYSMNQFLKTLARCEVGSIVVTTPDGAICSIGGAKAGPAAKMHIHDWRTVRSFALKGDIGLAEAYRDSWWSSDDLTALMQFGLENGAALEGYLYGNLLARMATRFFYYFSRNTLRGSKRNIHAHYDLGNEFYALWLDESMTYSSALFRTQHDSLQHAQYNKYDRMLDQLNSKSGRLLEIGCGWGGMAERALTKGDYDYKGITLSPAQQAYAKQRVDAHATIALEDYRHQQGSYDHIVSIEMFEAVGEDYWATYFEKIKSLLASKGKAIIQTITIDDVHFDRYRSGGDMIRSFIFPGGMLPSPSRFEQEAAKADLRVTDSFAFGQDYAQTLRQWLTNFEDALPQVRALGFDDGFIRIWRFYLAACIASFSVSRTDVMQLELQHA